MDYYRQKRVERLQKYIGEQGLDAMLITSKDAVFYLSAQSCGAETGIRTHDEGRGLRRDSLVF